MDIGYTFINLDLILPSLTSRISIELMSILSDISWEMRLNKIRRSQITQEQKIIKNKLGLLESAKHTHTCHIIASKSSVGTLIWIKPR